MNRFRINQPSVIHQTIEGEVIIIHLETGTYYSLTSSAAWIWERLAAGQAVEETAAELTRHFEVEAAEAESTLREFIEQVLSEKLLVESAPPVTDGLPEAQPRPVRAPFPRPAIEKFTDMQQLLLLDPIHEVDERGWPHQPGAKP